MPSAAAARTPSTTTRGPRSAPRPSRATGVMALLGGRVGVADLVRDHLAPGVGAADRADTVRQARAVAARALVESRLRRPVGRAALVAPLRGLSFLRDGHARGGMVAGSISRSSAG